MPRIKKPRVFPCQWTKADKDKLRVNAFRNTGLQETFFGAISGLCSPRGNIRIQEHVRRRIAAVFFAFTMDGRTHLSGFRPTDRHIIPAFRRIERQKNGGLLQA